MLVKPNANLSGYRNVPDTTEVLHNLPNNLFSDTQLVQELIPCLYLDEDKISKNNDLGPIESLISSTLNPYADPFFIVNDHQMNICEHSLSHEECHSSLSSDTSDNAEVFSI